MFHDDGGYFLFYFEVCLINIHVMKISCARHRIVTDFLDGAAFARADQSGAAMPGNIMTLSTVMERDQVAAAYDRWAPVYDAVFGPVFRQGRRAAVRAAERLGGRILEVGVGTGLSLAEYSRATRIFGIDISQPMLDKARGRVEKFHLNHVEALEVMDAENLDFPDASFDVVVAQYVVTAIPNPEKALAEFLRVLRPGGEIILTTRISAESGMRGTLEKWLMPLTSRAGFRTEFPWSRYECWAESTKATRLVERRALPPMGHFSLLRYVRVTDPVS